MRTHDRQEGLVVEMRTHDYAGDALVSCGLEDL